MQQTDNPLTEVFSTRTATARLREKEALQARREMEAQMEAIQTEQSKLAAGEQDRATRRDRCTQRLKEIGKPAERTASLVEQRARHDGDRAAKVQSAANLVASQERALQTAIAKADVQPDNCEAEITRGRRLISEGTAIVERASAVKLAVLELDEARADLAAAEKKRDQTTQESRTVLDAARAEEAALTREIDALHEEIRLIDEANQRRYELEQQRMRLARTISAAAQR